MTKPDIHQFRRDALNTVEAASNPVMAVCKLYPMVQSNFIYQLADFLLRMHQQQAQVLADPNFAKLTSRQKQAMTAVSLDVGAWWYEKAADALVETDNYDWTNTLFGLLSYITRKQVQAGHPDYGGFMVSEILPLWIVNGRFQSRDPNQSNPPRVGGE